MPIKTIRLEHFRCFDRLDVPLSNKLTLISGANGTGKTSILEALYFLGRGRSFRSRNAKTLIQNQSTFFRLVATDDHGVVGLERGSQEATRIYGENVPRSSELSKVNPVLFIGPDIQQLVAGGPSGRRRFLDWGVFHVKHEYHSHWARYQRALKQRNELLKANQAIGLLEPWDVELAATAGFLDMLRVEYLDAFLPELFVLLQEHLPHLHIDVQYQRGWSGEEDFALFLKQQHAKDRMRRLTVHGPHRADLNITVDRQAAVNVLSRGQQKLLACLMIIAQNRVTQKLAGIHALVLVDDLGAELDQRFQQWVMEALLEAQCQVVLSAISDQIPMVANSHLSLVRTSTDLSPTLKIIE